VLQVVIREMGGGPAVKLKGRWQHLLSLDQKSWFPREIPGKSPGDS